MQRMSPRRRNLYLLHRAIEEAYLLDRDFDDADAHIAGEASDLDALISAEGLILKPDRSGSPRKAGGQPKHSQRPAAHKGKPAP